ncbi:MAG: transposase [Clostridia bacterium]|nr:transposase [Clostridia bacterium]
MALKQIINSLREAEVLISQGNTTAQAARHLGITEQTYYRWRKEYGGMRINQTKGAKKRKMPGLKKLVTN